MLGEQLCGCHLATRTSNSAPRSQDARRSWLQEINLVTDSISSANTRSTAHRSVQAHVLVTLGVPPSQQKGRYLTALPRVVAGNIQDTPKSSSCDNVGNTNDPHRNPASG